MTKMFSKLFNIKKISVLSLILLLVTPLFLSAQEEVLTGLTGNPMLIHSKAQSSMQVYGTLPEPVKLPFVDDFSNYIGYPNKTLWQDKQAFVNQGYSIAPPTLGVATLDALDQNGKIYAHAKSTPFPADTLTSLPIRLDSIFTTPRKIKIQDSLYFSFYFQPGGGVFPQEGTPKYREWERVGDAPETSDSLVLEFGYATGDTIFIGYSYSYVVLDYDYISGDTLWNPYIDGDYIVFSEFHAKGDSVMMPSDSLMGPEMVWNHVWSTPGFTLDPVYEQTGLFFQQVMIPITDAQYLRDNFQFRFRNYASLESNGITGWASNVDQWHIDYVRLNINRTYTDIYPNDVAFVTPVNSLLKKYQAMPWNQFRPADLRSSFDNCLTNISNTVKNTNYSYTVVKNGTAQIGEYESNNENANPYHINGWHTYGAHAHPPVQFTIPQDHADSAEVVITHVFQVTGGTGDERHENDTCRFYQKFYNYYAYDDGTAEAGYSILSAISKPNIYLAMRYELAQPDTLRSVRMWFNHVQNDANMQYFTLMVWNDNGGVPGEVIYSKEGQLPQKAEEFLDFVDYYTDPVAISGVFYVGFYQNTNAQLNIGFDANNDARDHFMYKTGSEWKQPLLKGTPMIRPVVGKHWDVVGIRDVKPATLRVFPNPTTSYVNVELNRGTERPADIRLYDAQGRLLQRLPAANNDFNEVRVRVDMSSLPTGLYFVKAGSAVAKVVKR